MEFTRQAAIITPYTAGFTSLWEGVDGQFSATFFKHFVVDIDFDESVITLIEPEKFKYAGSGSEISMKPVGLGLWAIPVSMETAGGGAVELDIPLDLGNSHALSILTGGPDNLRLPDKALETSLGFGIGGEILGHLGRVASVRFGAYRVPDVLTAFAEWKDEETLANKNSIGFGLLSRSNIIFDYPHRRIFVEPNERIDDPFEFNMSGFALRQNPEGHMEIFRIIEDSPASEADLKVGDLLTSFDGRATKELKPWDLAPLFREEGRIIKLGVLSAGKKREIAIVLRRLI